MAGAIGWCGPLIDLSAAPSHIGDYVQLVVFVHRSTPVQYKLSKGGTVIRTDIHVGDDTRPFFSVSLWGKQMGSLVSAGDIILLQNVRITRFANVIEARTVQYSSILSLVHPYEALFSKGMDDLVGSCRVGITVKEKTKKVIEWVQRSRPTFHDELQSLQKRRVPRNWKVHEEQISRKCYMLSEVLHLGSTCKAIFHASVGEIFLAFGWPDFDNERMFISKQLINGRDTLVKDMICTGCQQCGLPLGLDSVSKQKDGLLYSCEKSSNRLHTVGSIYRPFMLYVWDDSEYIPLRVTNGAAELLFADIKADKVLESYNWKKHRNPANPEATKSISSVADGGLTRKGKDLQDERRNFYLIWLILLKMLLLRRNSPLKFEVLVSPGLKIEEGRFKMTSASFPCFSSSHEKS
ncbi:hypothetical protein Nepgr_023676 [Nepenthes gracilis]|uniref:Uncharacterized protein n=1 Tax=Nepenthes gracilis TaxID=150966 RepID=A0AAD3T2K2_NEPGR|nr:hypothetical protein Nepgr_023676 [Nepenthes gracilis]